MLAGQPAPAACAGCSPEEMELIASTSTDLLPLVPMAGIGKVVVGIVVVLVVLAILSRVVGGRSRV